LLKKLIERFNYKFNKLTTKKLIKDAKMKSGTTLESVGEYWDSVYDAFHKNNPPRMSVWNKKPHPYFSRLIDFLKYKGVKNVLDAGCGEGRESKPFHDAGFHIIGVDASQSALKLFREHFMESKNITLVRALLENLPIEPESVGALICYHVLTHIREVDKTLDNFHTILRNGGYALLEFTSKKDSTYGQGEKISDREFLQQVVYLRYDEPKDIEKMLKKFEIISPFTSEYRTDPPHGTWYIRKKRHRHHSYFVIAQKRKD